MSSGNKVTQISYQAVKITPSDLKELQKIDSRILKLNIDIAGLSLNLNKLEASKATPAQLEAAKAKLDDTKKQRDEEISKRNTFLMDKQRGAFMINGKNKKYEPGMKVLNEDIPKIKSFVAIKPIEPIFYLGSQRSIPR